MSACGRGGLIPLSRQTRSLAAPNGVLSQFEPACRHVKKALADGAAVGYTCACWQIFNDEGVTENPDVDRRDFGRGCDAV